MWITKTSIRHPVFATMVMVGLMVLGVFSYKSLGVESMPNVEIPAVWVETNYPGASPEQVENDVTRPIEEVANTVSGIKTIRSNSWEGRSGVSLEFNLETDMDRAVQDLRDKVSRVRATFPREVKEPVVLRQDGWEIVYAYSDGDAKLPARLQLSQSDLEVRIVVLDRH